MLVEYEFTNHTISIHSLVRGRTVKSTLFPVVTVYFNPLPRERENYSEGVRKCTGKISIHSLVRGRTPDGLGGYIVDWSISIHSLVRGRTRCAFRTAKRSRISIHSLVRGRTYVSNADKQWYKISIHSLVRGRTAQKESWVDALYISIHSLVRGRTRRCLAANGGVYQISIHSLVRGRTMFRQRRVIFKLFQSTPS